MKRDGEDKSILSPSLASFVLLFILILVFHILFVSKIEWDYSTKLISDVIQLIDSFAPGMICSTKLRDGLLFYVLLCSLMQT